MISKVLFTLYFITFSYELGYLAKLRLDTIDKIYDILVKEGYNIDEDYKEKLFNDINFYLKYKYIDFTDHMTYNYVAMFPIVNLYILKRIIDKSLKNEYKLYEDSILEERFLKENKLERKEEKDPIKPNISITPKSNIRTRNIIKKRVLKK